MGPLVPGLGSRTKYKMDYSLLPLGVILMEFSVFATQWASDSYSSVGNLIAMRLVHTIGMLILALSVGWVLTRKQLFELGYLTSAAICTAVIVLGDLMHGYLADAFGVELISLYRRIGIVLLQGTLWFPALMIVLGNRRDIVQSFKAYEQRLIAATRARTRRSKEFKSLQGNAQSRIREELFSLCSSLKESLVVASNSASSLTERSDAIRPLLIGEDLRELSRKLESIETRQVGGRFLGIDTRSVSLLVKQFGILYATTVRKAPLGRRAYILVFLALVTPPYINFYSFSESLFSYPILIGLIFIFAHLITRLQSAGSLRNSTILIFLAGLLPFITNLVGQAIFHDPETQFPILLTAVAFPVTYYLFMELLQVLRPTALSLIRKDELKASQSLQDEVTEIVTEEFSYNLSHQWAVYIHGKILTRLATNSLKLEAASKAEDSKEFEQTVERLIALLKDPDAEFELITADLQKEVTSRLDPWVGLLDIDLYIDPALESVQTPRVRDLAEVIEELISNSIRHGKAKKIELKVLRSGAKDVEIVAIDDSTMPPSSADKKSGLGTHIFNLASDGRWSIKRVGSTTEFRLTMTLES
jgi:two-component sensor histidine kinase